ncbi:MAG: hypothetical protein WEC12_02810 [Balneolaceae bacterium]
MEELNGVTIYWLISIGLMIGFIMDVVMGRRGVSLGANLAGGVIGSVLIGVIAIILQLFGSLIFASIGTVSFLFLVNIFKFEPEYKDDTEIANR